MRYGIDVANLGACAEPATVVELARAAERAGWDGLFVWDHVAAPWGGQDGPAAGDPWVLLAAVACATESLTLGTNATPVARRRPHVLAAQAATLDRLSGGRVVLGVGLGGVTAEFEAYGEPGDPALRAQKLDEGLAVITRLWSGEPVRHAGPSFVVDGVRHRLRPVRSPRLPVWVGGTSRPALRRAARWDGWTAGLTVDQAGALTLRPVDLAESVAFLRSQRSERPENPASAPFEVAVSGLSDPADRRLVAEYGDAGATWWLESITDFRGSPPELLARVAAGPPA